MIQLAQLNGSPEIFYSLQGEGVSLGMPSIFVRLSLCNLHCVWCDTDYTWNWQGTPWPHQNDALPGYQKFNKSEYILSLSPADLADQIAAFPCKNVIFTGGEPLLQADAIFECMQHLDALDSGYRFEIETNATKIPPTALAERVTQFNLSPKLAHSGNALSLRENPKALIYFSKLPSAWFKFVVSSQSDLEEIQDLERRYALPKDRILLMPEGQNPAQLAERRLWLAEICKAHGYRLTERLHVLIWGAKRGV